MNRFICIFLFFSLLSSCQEKEISVQDRLADCTYSVFPDNGKELKQAINDYEKYLIRVNFIQNSTGQSYRAIFDSISKTGSLSYNDIDSVLSDYYDYKGFMTSDVLDSITECQKEIFRMYSKEIREINSLKAQEQIAKKLKAQGSISAQELASITSEQVNLAEFENPIWKLDFYRKIESAVLLEREYEASKRKWEVENRDKVIWLNTKGEFHFQGKILSSFDLEKLVEEKKGLIRFEPEKGIKYGLWMEKAQELEELKSKYK